MQTNPRRTGKPFSLINAQRDVITNPQTDTFHIDGYDVSCQRVSRGYRAWVDLGAPFYRVESYAPDRGTAIERVAERANKLRTEMSEPEAA